MSIADQSLDDANQSKIKNLYWEEEFQNYSMIFKYISSFSTPDIREDVMKNFMESYFLLQRLIEEDSSVADDEKISAILNLDSILRIIYPITIDSLKISEAMSKSVSLENSLKYSVKKIIKKWRRNTIIIFFLSILSIIIRNSKDFIEFINHHILNHISQNNYNCLIEISPNSIDVFLVYTNSALLGCLGACSYILRSILQGIANKTYILREEETYSVRAMLGAILGVMIPRMINSIPSEFSLLMEVGVPFLAGYAVESMFSALDNAVLTLKEAVGRNGNGGAIKGKP